LPAAVVRSAPHLVEIERYTSINTRSAAAVVGCSRKVLEPSDEIKKSS